MSTFIFACFLFFLYTLTESLNLNQAVSQHKIQTVHFGSSGGRRRPTSATPSTEFGAKCSEPSKPRIAILIFGMARGLVVDKVLDSFEKHVKAPLVMNGARGLEKQTPDIFVHVKLGDRNKSDGVSAMRRLDPMDYELVEGVGKYGDAENTQTLLANPSCFHGKHMRPDHLQHCMGRDWSVQEAHLMMEKYEKSLQKEYDVVIFTRADVEYRADVQIPELNCEQGHIHHDFFATLPRKRSDLMRNILQDYYFNPNPHGCGGYYNAEGIWSDAVAKWHEEVPDFSVYYTKDVGPGTQESGAAQEGGHAGMWVLEHRNQE